jgi:hypothetical protein
MTKIRPFNQKTPKISPFHQSWIYYTNKILDFVFHPNGPQSDPEDYHIFGSWTDIKEIYPRAMLYYYFLMFQNVIKILNGVFGDKPIIKPPDDLNYKYIQFLDALDITVSRPDFFKIRKIDFDKYLTLNGDLERMAIDWNTAHGYFTDELAKVEKEFLLHGAREYTVPNELISTFKEIDELLTELKSKKQFEKVSSSVNKSVINLPKNYLWNDDKSVYIVGSFGELSFGHKRTQRKIIFEALTLANNWVEVSVLVAKLDNKISGDDVRSVISQLNQRLKTNGLSKYLKIEASGKGSYKLTALSS